MAEVAVVGSCNLDLVLPVRLLPRPGETVEAVGASEGGGGKGANQAVALARLGRHVAMVGTVGDGPDGDRLRALLDGEGIDIAGIATVPGPSGRAIVLVEPDGESTIVVAPGANAAMTADRVDAAAETVAAARAVMLQHEVPVEALRRATELASGLVVLNPAPARPVPPEVLARVDLLVPNRHELCELAGRSSVRDLGHLAALAAEVAPGRDVVVTLGADGALTLPVDGEATHVRAREVVARDATAAGDSFCAALVDARLDGATLTEATDWACRVAAETVTRPGAMASLPSRAAIGARGHASAGADVVTGGAGRG
ncbi:ribokinase [Nitriliruptoraceae bacterium ZYF776]|nr:ribokinase [Profundirhabdus halotolerans]